MQLPDQLHCLFSAQIEDRGDSYVLEIPRQEVEVGSLQEGHAYRVAILLRRGETTTDDETRTRDPETERETNPTPQTPTEKPEQRPPVEPGEKRIVEIESLGDQGDGITRVDRGFVVIVPDTEQGERVEIEITDVRENVAFAEVVERISYYD